MKKRFYILMACSVMAGATSCNKFLDLQPSNEIGEAVALDSEEKLQRALNGAYSRMQVSEYYGFEWTNAIWLSDDNVVPYSSGTTDLQFDGYAVLSSSNTIDINWKAMYQVINAANNVIDGAANFNDPSFTADEKNNMIGQALFLRGLTYFDLARTFGGVPLILKPTRGLQSDSYPAKSTADQVYAQVLTDLNEAEAKLPESTSRIYATKKAATALKARLFLYQKKWAEAEQAATTVIADNDYVLVKPYEKLITDKATTESIFELQYNGNDGNPLSGLFLPQALGGTYRIGPTNGFVTLMNDAAKSGSRNVLIGMSGGQPYGNRYRRVGTGRNDDNVIILRLAEMYLIRAEARAQQPGKLADGLADVNEVRRRADLTNAAAGTQAALLQLIEDERRIEFAFEPHRWFDLIRTGRAGAVLGVTDAKKYVFPLPANEVLTNKQLIQNDGY
ncbi:MAG: RagB/SusD family nutrient uptake outer membrane protein [Niastella sp.]|nr:RagB/SusD family nutrient uptake outer membrane protein [Niastella sp.]